ncbi:MAG: hypothetical protein ACR2GG_10625 [Gemmatimonadaceae bacterium]
MADNSVQSGGDTIRDKDRAGVKTQIVGLDVGIGTGTESLLSAANPLPISGSVNPDVLTVGTLAANNAAVTAVLSGQPTVMVAISGVYAGTVTFQGQWPDGTWNQVPAIFQPVGSAGYNTTATGTWRVQSSGLQAFRTLMSPYTSGTATASIVASYAGSWQPGADALGETTQYMDSRNCTPILARTYGAGPAAMGLIPIVDANGQFVVVPHTDTARVPVTMTVSGQASVTSEALLNMTRWRLGATTTATTYTVPAGKVFRIQAIQFGVRFTTPSATVTFGSTTFRIRAVASGTATATSAILHQDSKLAASNVATPNSDLEIGDGLDLPAGYNFGVSHAASATGLSEDVLIVGYEYTP